MCVGRLGLSLVCLALLTAAPARAQAPPEATTPITLESRAVLRAADCDSAGPVVIGAEDRDLPVEGGRHGQDLFASFGAAAHTVRRVHDAREDEAGGALKPHVDEMACAGAAAWLYRFAYVSQPQPLEDTPAIAASVSRHPEPSAVPTR